MQTIKQVSWEDISKQVEAVNPEFAKIVNTIEPVKSKYPLYVLTYRYGDMIDGPDGEFRFPVGDQLVDINSDLLDKQFQKDLGYSKNITPGGLLLSGAIELFLETDSRVIPRKMVMPGDLIAMWAQLETDRHFHPVQAMRSSVGARSIFMLPNIGDYSQHKNLKKDFNLKLAPPKALLDQWKVFKTLTANAAVQDDWKMELLVFPESWVTAIKSDSAWTELYTYLLMEVWLRSGFERNQIFYDHAFSLAQSMGNLRPNPYLSDTFKHWIALGVGAFPGFKVATDDSVAPIKALQKIYVESYGLTKYLPSIFHPVHYDFHQDQFPIYYSLQNATTIACSPKSRKVSSTLYDLRELKNIADTYVQRVLNGDLHLESTVVCELLRTKKMDFFHSKIDGHSEILASTELPAYDSGFDSCLINLEGPMGFASTGTFIRGCVGYFNT